MLPGASRDECQPFAPFSFTRTGFGGTRSLGPMWPPALGCAVTSFSEQESQVRHCRRAVAVQWEEGEAQLPASWLPGKS